MIHHAQKNFYPRSPCGERRSGRRYTRRHGAISIHALLAESDCRAKSVETDTGISIHALLAESDASTTTITICTARFLSTLSLRRATALDISARRGARISIHALLAESDTLGGLWVLSTQIFLSTLSLRRATDRADERQPGLPDFYPRSPCGERQARAGINSSRTRISIHALLAESDRRKERPFPERKGFLSTLSLRRATSPEKVFPFSGTYFYPRSPCGERLFQGFRMVGTQSFLSTLSLRRATLFRLYWLWVYSISIHALLAESDA